MLISIKNMPIPKHKTRNYCPINVSVYRISEAEMSVTQYSGSNPRYPCVVVFLRYDKCLNSGGEYVEKLLNTCSICSLNFPLN